MRLQFKDQQTLHLILAFIKKAIPKGLAFFQRVLVQGILASYSIFSFGGPKTLDSVPTFRLHIIKEPSQFDPAMLASGNGQFFLSQINANLYRLDALLNWKPDLAKKCYVTGRKLTCLLRDDLKWSDGSALTAQDFIDEYTRVLKMRLLPPRIDEFFVIEGAENYVYGRSKKLPSWKVISPTQFELPLVSRNARYESLLGSLLWSPQKTTQDGVRLSSGAYQIQEIRKGQWIELSRNPYFYHSKINNSGPLRVRFYFIQEDTTAVRLYENHELDFLRRLPSLMISRFEKRADFMWIPLIRFDYLGFGKKMQDEVTRGALAEALDTQQWQELYSSPSRPGCFDLPDSWIGENDASKKKKLCLDSFFLPAGKTKMGLKNKDFTFFYSASGGDDHRRTAEWLQFQWDKKLKVSLKVQAMENALFQEKLPTGDFDVFRHGVSPESPDCLSSIRQIKVFSNQTEWERILRKTENAWNSRYSLSRQATACKEALEFLLNKHLVIPTGKIFIASLLRPEWKGLIANELNQLDLRDLSYEGSKPNDLGVSQK